MTTWSVRAILAGRKTQTRRPTDWLSYTVGEGFRWKKAVGRKGDFVRVRETFRVSPFGRPVFRADTKDENWKYHKWTPSRFMPKGYARLFLELMEEPRLELVKEISAADAIAEGIELPSDMLSLWSVAGTEDEQVARAALDSFKLLWDSIYAKQGHGWDSYSAGTAGPTRVWRYVFKPILQGAK